MEPIPHLTGSELADRYRNRQRPFHRDLYALFSSDYQGIVTDPAWMLVPVDDHLVHRGDGVFETLKCLDGNIYCLDAHLERLRQSAAAIHLSCPWTAASLTDILFQTIRAGGHKDCLVRILLSRGIGSMGISPADCPDPGLYVAVHRLSPPFMDLHPEGARVCTSRIPLKPGFLANVKTCNYLPNALIKLDAVREGADFALTFDEEGHLAEGATENAGILSCDNRLIFPEDKRILEGTTMRRVFELATTLVDEGLIAGRDRAGITVDAIRQAREMYIIGTTANITAVTRFDDTTIGSGKPGPVYERLSRLFLGELHGGTSAYHARVPGL